MVALSAAIMVRYRQGNQSQAATLCYGGIKKHPPDERKEGDTMVTYSVHKYNLPLVLVFY